MTKTKDKSKCSGKKYWKKKCGITKFCSTFDDGELAQPIISLGYGRSGEAHRRMCKSFAIHQLVDDTASSPPKRNLNLTATSTPSKGEEKKNINMKENAKGAQPAHKRSLPSIDVPPICSWVLASPVRVRFSAFAFLFLKGFVTHGVRIKWKEWCVESRIDLQSHRDLWKRKSWAALHSYPKRR